MYKIDEIHRFFFQTSHRVKLSRRVVKVAREKREEKYRKTYRLGRFVRRISREFDFVRAEN